MEEMIMVCFNSGNRSLLIAVFDSIIDKKIDSVIAYLKEKLYLCALKIVFYHGIKTT